MVNAWRVVSETGAVIGTYRNWEAARTVAAIAQFMECRHMSIERTRVWFWRLGINRKRTAL